MRKSFLAVAIQAALGPANPNARPGPISPYNAALNREAYLRLMGQEVVRARSIGKTLTYGNRYA